ncbi:hypothetical protein LWI28_022369 [Acer negundo]|uniref:Uncharacterized protein n=1 Tax=Acer negundo TaxID=4023 RepID=A0AAD5JBL6_ACENE|nr:hypothetical protein LWI28_022369 [Acer negundo]
MEAEARVEGLKKSKQVNKPIGNVKKQGHAQKDGFKGGSKKSECGLANCDGDGDYVKGHKLGNGVSNAVNGKLSLSMSSRGDSSNKEEKGEPSFMMKAMQQ